MFPPNNGASDVLSPRAIITGTRPDYKRHCRIEPGSYVQTHEEHDNSMQSRTLGAIALRPAGNAQGSYYFLNLRAGHRIMRMRWTELNMPDEVINRVHILARRSKAHPGLTFAFRDGTEVIDKIDDEDSVTDPDYDPLADPEAHDDVSLSDDEDDDADGGDNDKPIDPVEIAGVADPAKIAGVNDNNQLNQDDLQQENPHNEPDHDPIADRNEEPIEGLDTIIKNDEEEQNNSDIENDEEEQNNNDIEQEETIEDAVEQEQEQQQPTDSNTGTGTRGGLIAGVPPQQMNEAHGTRT